MTDTIFSNAQKVLSHFGWQQGGYGNPEAGYCLYGALGKGQGLEAGDLVEDNHGPTTRKVWDALDMAGSHLDCEAVSWNDARGRTKEDVLNLLQEMHEKELAQRGLLHAETATQNQAQPAGGSETT